MQKFINLGDGIMKRQEDVQKDVNAAQAKELRRLKAEQAKKEQAEVDAMVTLFNAAEEVPQDVLAQQAAAFARNEQRVQALRGESRAAEAPRVDRDEEEAGVRPAAPAVVDTLVSGVGTQPEERAFARFAQVPAAEKAAARAAREEAELKKAMEAIDTMEKVAKGEATPLTPDAEEVRLQEQRLDRFNWMSADEKAAAKAAREDAELKKALAAIAALEASVPDKKHVDESDRLSAEEQERRRQEKLFASFQSLTPEESAVRTAARIKAREEAELRKALGASMVDAPKQTQQNRCVDALGKRLEAVATAVAPQTQAAAREPEAATVRVVFSDSANALEVKPLPVVTSAPVVEKKVENEAAKAAREVRARALAERLEAAKAKAAGNESSSNSAASSVGTQASTSMTTAASTTTGTAPVVKAKPTAPKK